MKKNIFIEEMDGLAIDRVVRDYEYSMTSRHFHESYELYFLLEGERYYFIEKETFLVKCGSAVLVGRNQIHKTSMAGNSCHDRIVLQVKAEAFDDYLMKNGIRPLAELFASHYGVIDLTAADWEQCCRILFDIQDELEKKLKGYEAMVRLELAQLFLLLSRYCGRESQNQELFREKSRKYQIVDEVAEYLSNCPHSKESLDELSARFFISKAYLTRIFRDVTGYTVNEYRNVARVKKGKRLLRNSDYSITEIAEILGFESITYFERVFKQHTDSAPLRYRKRS